MKKNYDSYDLSNIYINKSSFTPRIKSLDALRGLVMIIMALDHSRDFFDADGMRFSATDLDQTYPALFFTRLASHFCAPAFVFLAGASVFLWRRTHTIAEARKFIVTRGLWLILLDLIVISPIWTHEFGKFGLDTLSAIGFGFLALAATISIPPPGLLLIGATIIGCHDLLDAIHANDLGAFGSFWPLLHERGPLPFGFNGRVHYPILPWIGIMLIGYGAGPVFIQEPGVQRKWLFGSGAALCLFFIVLRFSNYYGDPHPWRFYPDPLMTLMSFLNVSKYPPSLLYAAMTLGPTLALLPAIHHLPNLFMRILIVFGGTPLFFYVTHLYVIVGASFLYEMTQGFRIDEIIAILRSSQPPPGYGAGLSGAYVAWLAIVATLYPVCRRFAVYKSARTDWWLKYL